MIGKQCDTIFEIGGQDSKFISLQDGIVVDFTMNEACAAGTGSFLEEQAEELGIAITDEFAELALGSERAGPAGRALHRVHGARRQRRTSSGAPGATTSSPASPSASPTTTSTAWCASGTIGDVIFFQGGTAYNDAVAAAFSQILGKEIIVPPHNGVMGAIGMALLARERVTAHGGAHDASAATTSSRWTTRVREFICKGCSNECDVQEFTSRARRRTGATSAPTATASGPRSTRSR